LRKKGSFFFDFSIVEAVIFDVDGTLYNQKNLRRRMYISLAMSLWRDPKCIRICRVLNAFRCHRERAALNNAKDSLKKQYNVVARHTHQRVEFVEDVVEEWMFRRPLKHLGKCLYDGVDIFFNAVREQGLKIGVFSDYPADDKLSAMGLSADVNLCSTDMEVQRLKPDPKGLLLCCKRLNVAPQKTLYIGDRDGLDGDCARRADIPFLKVPSHKDLARKFYRNLTQQLHMHRRTDL
jgi:phosphoglycolate phosphatase/putative hydrolase of the HAD superfamily